jgi:peptidoglycan/xylan/chitin deacetylase (PgdA/CDA1 family)
MKIKIMLLIGLMTGVPVFGQRVAPPYEVGTWQGFKPAAISYTFDDNCPNQLAKAVPLFDKYSFKATLFTVINLNPNWSGLQAAANNGHEIASHTVTHPSLDSISESYQTREYKDSRDIINRKITGQKCLTIAYPFCANGKSNLCSECYIAARSCDGFLASSTPGDFMNIGSINCGTEGEAKTTPELNAKVESAISSKAWCVFMLHGIDDDKGFSPLRSEELGSHLNYVSANSSKFWVNTFGNVVRYIKERNAVSLTILPGRSKHISIQLTDSLDNSVYNYPVSIRRPLPRGWKNARVKQGTANLTVQRVKQNSVDYIQFDAVPNAGTIIISKRKG